MLAIPLAVLAALCNALTTIFQRMGVETAPENEGRGLKLLRHVVRRPIWYVGFAAMIGSFGFQATALGFGGLSVVQPLMVSELLFLVLILRVWFGSPLGWREAIGTVLTVAGLAGFLAMSNAGGGTTFPTTTGWAIVIVGLFGGCPRLCRLYPPPGVAGVAVRLVRRRRGHLVLLERGVHQGDDDPVLERLLADLRVTGSRMRLSWRESRVSCLTQDAFHAGPITASQATLTIVDPIVSIVIGVGLFGDELRGGIGALAFDAVFLLVMCAGLFVLTQSPLIAGATAHEHLGRSRLDHRTGRSGRRPGAAGRLA